MTDSTAGKDRRKKPRAFNVSQQNSKPDQKTGASSAKRAPQAEDVDAVTFDVDPFDEAEFDDVLDSLTSHEDVIEREKRFSLFSLLSWLLAAFFALIIGLSIESYIDDLFQSNLWFGRAALLLTLLIALCLLIFLLREWLALRRLRTLSAYRQRADEITENQSSEQAKVLALELVRFYGNYPDLAEGRTRLSDANEDIMDARDRLNLLESSLMTPLDIRAQKLILDTAKRVSVVTAISPRAIVDMAYVGYESIKLMRQLSTLYGGRANNAAIFRLIRLSFTNLAISGGLALTDGLVSQLFGHGLASKLSAKFGEGIINALLVVRLGLSAQRLIRPMPFQKDNTPEISDYLRSIWQKSPENNS